MSGQIRHLMRLRFAATLAALALPLFAVTACGSDESIVEVVTTTVPASTPATSTPSSTTSEAPATSTSQNPKQVASCGDTSIHEMGTTFFTDGSSGWTQTCQDRMAATYVPPAPVPTFDQDAYNQQFAEEYWRNNPRPTFDPDSADGYGPDQKLPPACLRFENVDC